MFIAATVGFGISATLMALANHYVPELIELCVGDRVLFLTSTAVLFGVAAVHFVTF